MFCGPCAILLSSNSRHDKGILVNKPFNNWVKISDTLTKHSHLRGGSRGGGGGGGGALGAEAPPPFIFRLYLINIMKFCLIIII